MQDFTPHHPNESDLEHLLREALADPLPSQRAIARGKALMPGPLATALQHLFERARELIAELRLDTRAQPALAGFRASPAGDLGAGWQLLFTAAEHELFLQVEAPAEPGAPFRLRGQIDSASAASLRAQVAAAPARSERPATMVTAQADGRFDLELAPGTYDLAVALEPPFLVRNLELA